uniref:LPS-assembly protein LptD n=1 Tax=Desulfobacca acetoxidans TaxID=60893 RepID=A0A7C5AMF9_9BACT
MASVRVWLGIFLFFLISGLALAAEVEILKDDAPKAGAWRLRAGLLVYDAATREYTASGGVELVQGDRRLSCEWAKVNEVTKVARLKGQVLIVLGEDRLSGQEGVFNLVTRCGEMHGARLFLKRNNFHVESVLIRKTGEQTFYAEEAVVTTCDAARPPWSFKTRKINVVVEGQARAQGTTLRLAGLPVLYTPFLSLPVLRQRQSGLLLPHMNFDRSSGLVLEFPVYWAINNHSDATFYQNYLSRRGYMQGFDLRYRGFKDAAGDLRLVYLKDGKADAPVPDRYWVTGMVNQPLTDRLQLRLSLDRVSDSDFYKTFNYGYLGLNTFNRDLLGEYGRMLEQQEVSTRLSTLLLSGNFPRVQLTAFGRAYQRLNVAEPFPFNQAPGVRLATLTTPLGKLPFMVGLESTYGYYFQNQGGRGHRLDFHPQVWFHSDLFSLLSMEARGGFRESIFLVDREDPAGRPVSSSSRELYDLKVSLASTWFRDFGREEGKTTFYRHYLRPEITYWNTPKYNPRLIPFFYPFDWGWVDRTSRNLPVREGEEPLGGVNMLTYGFSTSLLKRSETPQGQAEVRDLLWFRLLHGYFFNSTNMGIDGLPQHHHQFSEFLGEMEIYPYKRLILGSEVGLSPYAESFSRAKVKFVYFDRFRRQYLDVSYLFIKNYANQINVAAYLDLIPSLKTWVTFNHTFLYTKKLERQYGVILQRQCWGVAITITDRPDDTRVGVSLFVPSLMERTRRLPVNFPSEARFVKD